MTKGRRIKSVIARREAESFRFWNLSVPYDLPVLFSFVVSIFTVIYAVFAFLSGPGLHISNQKIGLSFRNFACYENVSFAAPIIQLPMINNSTSENLHLEFGSLKILVNGSDAFVYEHDRHLKYSPRAERCENYERAGNYEFPFVSIEKSSAVFMSTMYRPYVEANSKAGYFLDFAEFYKGGSVNDITIDVRLKILNSSFWQRIWGSDTVDMRCSVMLDDEIRASAKQRNFFDVRPICTSDGFQ